MIIARVIQGVGGGVLPLAFGIIRDEFPKDKVGGAVGITAALLAVGAGLGIILAGPIVDALNYHWLFWIPMFMVIIAAVAAHLTIPESPVRTPGHISWGAALLLSGWLTASLVAVSEAPSWHWLSVPVVGLAVLAVLLAVAWVIVELRSSEPLIDMRMMRLPAVWTTNLVAMLFGIGMYSLFAFLPEFVQTPSSAGYGFGADITKSGLFLLPMTVTMFVFGLVSGRAARVFSSKIVLLVGAAISVVPLAILTVDHRQPWVIYLVMGLLGAGFGLAFSAMSSLIVESVPPSQTGVASGMNANIRTIGGSLGAAVMASIVTSHSQAGGLPRESGYTHGFVFLTIAGIAAAIACFAIPRGRLVPDQSQAELAHAELAILAAGTVTGDEPE
jgi:MFS family permease